MNHSRSQSRDSQLWFRDYLDSSTFSSFLAAGFFAGAFSAAGFFATSASILSSSEGPSFFAGLASSFTPSGAGVRAFNERPILFLLGSKLIILASTSSPTFTCSLMEL